MQKEVKVKEFIFEDKEHEDKREVTQLKAYTAMELETMELIPPEFVVHQLLPTGLTILGAPSKAGKSWMALDLAYSVSRGEPFLGFRTNKSTALYIGLEDSLHRLKSRLMKMGANLDHASQLLLITKCNTLDHGLLQQLDELMSDSPGIKLIIIDTLQMIKETRRNKDAYEWDYKQLSTLKAFADEREIALVVVHHTRKKTGVDDDVFAGILGSTALQAVPDTMFTIKKNREDKVATFYSMGRDVPLTKLCLEFDSECCVWKSLGTSHEVAIRSKREAYEQDLVVITLRKLMLTKSEWKGTLQDLADEILKSTHIPIEKTGKSLSKHLEYLAPMLESYDSIEYIPNNNHVSIRDGRSVRLFRFIKHNTVKI
jgi:hypothetical protein